MKTTIAWTAAVLALFAGAASAQYGRGDIVQMRDGSTIVTVGGCLVQYGARGQRINNANRCDEGAMRQADQMMSGGGRTGFSGGAGYGGGYGGAMPGGSWQQSCRPGQMRGNVFQTECRTGDGRMNSTVLDMRNCSTGNAENRNGTLVCE